MLKRKVTWLVLGIALAIGFAITWIDSRPGWDDTGITAGLVLLSTLALGFALPEGAWLWALAVGAGIPLVGILLHSNYGSLLALVIAFVGAFAGALSRKAFGALTKASL